jgi:perosamine synthetase
MPAYPKSQIPVQPVLSLNSFAAGDRPSRPGSILDAGPAKFVTSGRVAIALAMVQMGVGDGDKVLVPAYHCASMIQPVVWAGATPVFYKIRPDTSVDLDDLLAKIDGRTKVLMATNYFGFPQDLAKLRRFCDEHGLYLLEDCAHSFLGKHRQKPLGSYGDFAIASAMKFFPVYEGGCLVSSKHEIKQVQLTSAGLGFEAKSAFNALEKGFSYGRMSLLKATLALPLKLKNLLWAQVKKTAPSKSISLAPGASDGGFHFEPSWLHKRASIFSRLLIRTVPVSRIAEKRRRNYLLIHEALSGLPGCRPLFTDLPEDVVPYVYPLVCDNLQAVFPALKNAGVPIIRFAEYLWDGVDESVCPVSIQLSRQCMQLPCHQDLHPDELEWMIDMFKSINFTAQTKDAI